MCAETPIYRGKKNDDTYRIVDYAVVVIIINYCITPTIYTFVRYSIVSYNVLCIFRVNTPY